MNDATTSEKAAQLLEDINLLFADVAGHPRVERRVSKIRSTAIDLQGHILHLEQKADAESDGLNQLCAKCKALQRDLDHARRANAALEKLINHEEGKSGKKGISSCSSNLRGEIPPAKEVAHA